MLIFPVAGKQHHKIGKGKLAAALPHLAKLLYKVFFSQTEKFQSEQNRTNPIAISLDVNPVCLKRGITTLS